MKSSIVLSTLAVTAALAAAANAAVVTSGDVVVLRVGDGSATLGSTGTAAFLDEFNRTAGSGAVQNVGLSGSSAARLVVSGSATSEGGITLNNGYIGVAGYDAAVGTTGVAASTSATNPRRYLGLNVASDLATASPAVNGTTSQFSANNIRSVTTDGTNTYGAGGNSGTVLLPSTVVEAAPANTRVVNAINGNLYFSTGSGSAGIYGFAGTPTSTATATLLIADASPYAFSISPDGKAAFVADDTSGTGGIKKFTSADGVNFTLAYTLSLGATAAAGARGLAVDYTTSGGATVFATSADATTATAGNRLISFVDTGTSTPPTFNLLQTAAGNTAFRGVVVTPAAVSAPEPTTLAAVGGLASLLVGRRRRAV